MSKPVETACIQIVRCLVDNVLRLEEHGTVQPLSSAVNHCVDMYSRCYSVLGCQSLC